MKGQGEEKEEELENRSWRKGARSRRERGGGGEELKEKKGSV